MAKLSHIEKLRLQNDDAVLLCHAANKEGEPFYVYLATDAEGFQAIERAYDKGERIRFSDFGEVIERGYGEEPPEELQAYIAKKYAE